jgi:hypothetical protein
MSDGLPVHDLHSSAGPRRREQNRKGNLAIALGIGSLALCWLPLLGLLLAAGAIDFGRDGRAEVQVHRADNDRTARAAIVCGMAGAIISALVAVLALVVSLRAGRVSVLSIAGPTFAVVIATRLLRSRD